MDIPASVNLDLWARIVNKKRTNVLPVLVLAALSVWTWSTHSSVCAHEDTQVDSVRTRNVNAQVCSARMGENAVTPPMGLLAVVPLDLLDPFAKELSMNAHRGLA